MNTDTVLVRACARSGMIREPWHASENQALTSSIDKVRWLWGMCCDEIVQVDENLWAHFSRSVEESNKVTRILYSKLGKTRTRHSSLLFENARDLGTTPIHSLCTASNAILLRNPSCCEPTWCPRREYVTVLCRRFRYNTINSLRAALNKISPSNPSCWESVL